MSCRSPQNYPWVNTVLDKGYQVCELRSDLKYPTHATYKVLFLDQRGIFELLFSERLCLRSLTSSVEKGTGLSSTVTSKTLAREGGPRKQAEYLKHFRADSIGMSA